jgi:hypothetical protein
MALSIARFNRKIIDPALLPGGVGCEDTMDITTEAKEIATLIHAGSNEAARRLDIARMSLTDEQYQQLIDCVVQESGLGLYA